MGYAVRDNLYKLIIGVPEKNREVKGVIIQNVVCPLVNNVSYNIPVGQNSIRWHYYSLNIG